MPFELIWVVVVFGVNFAVWGSVGSLRLVEGAVRRRRSMTVRERYGTGTVRAIESGRESGWRAWRAGAVARQPVTLHNVAVLIPAHNEEAVLGRSLESLSRLIPRTNIYVVSDASTDHTVAIAAGHGVSVIETPGKAGKAGALEHGIRQFRLVERYDAVLLLDADSYLDPAYFEQALPLFDDPDVVAVAGCAHTEWNPPGVALLGKILISHRARIYAITQRLVKFGQTWRHTNALYIIPGFASMYRTSVLPYIDINPPGLVIEDFNMTFEVYRRRLGRVAFTLGAQALTQDPATFGDYVRQTKRWALGFWQAVRRYRPRAGLFPVMLVLLVTELVIASTLIVLLPIIIVLSVLPMAIPVLQDVQPFQLIHTQVNLGLVIIAVLVPDLVLTIAVAVVERRPRYLLFAPAFLPLRMVDAAITLYALPMAWAERSTGSWISPQRRRAATTSDVQLFPAQLVPGVAAHAVSIDGVAVGGASQNEMWQLAHSPRWTYSAGTDRVPADEGHGAFAGITARVPVQRAVDDGRGTLRRPLPAPTGTSAENEGLTALESAVPRDSSGTVSSPLPVPVERRTDVRSTVPSHVVGRVKMSHGGVVSGRVAAQIVHQLRDGARGATVERSSTVMAEAAQNVVGIAARQVPGVRCVEADVTRLVAAVVQEYDSGDTSKVSAQSIGVTAEVRLTLCLQYGFAVPTVTRWVRSAVVHALRNLLDVRAASIDIVVRDIRSNHDDPHHEHGVE